MVFIEELIYLLVVVVVGLEMYIYFFLLLRTNSPAIKKKAREGP
jgi:hypothetical protein